MVFIRLRGDFKMTPNHAFSLILGTISNIDIVNDMCMKIFFKTSYTEGFDVQFTKREYMENDGLHCFYGSL